MLKRQLQKINSREKLLISAAKCFAEKGFEGASISDIAKEAEMSSGSIYVHFTNKDDLFSTMIQEKYEEAAEAIHQATISDDTFINIASNILEQCVRDVGFPIDHRLWTEMLAVSARNDAIREVFTKSDRLMRDAFIGLLQKAVKNREIDPSLNLDDLEAISIWFYALIDGLIARTADDTDFNLEAQLPLFKSLLHNALMTQ